MLKPTRIEGHQGVLISRLSNKVYPLNAGPNFCINSKPGMDHFLTTGNVMACFRTKEECPARYYGFDFVMDNPRNQNPLMPRGTFLLQLDHLIFLL
jgi:hypothetical protein